MDVAVCMRRWNLLDRTEETEDGVIWIILAAIGVPLWLCAIAIVSLIVRNREIRKRAGNVPVRLHPPSAKRWKRGHAVWVHDVFAFRGSPAAWKEALVWVSGASSREPSPAEASHLKRIGDRPVVVTLTAASGERLDVATDDDHRVALMGPFALESARVPRLATQEEGSRS